MQEEAWIYAHHLCGPHDLQEPSESALFSGRSQAIWQVEAQRGWQPDLGHTAHLGECELVSSFQNTSIKQTAF